MKDEMEDAIDALLREQFEGPVPVGDFCDQVMDQLPARRPRNSWPLAAGVLAGVAMCGFSLWSAPIIYIGWRDWFSGDLSTSAIALFLAMTCLAILALVWIMAEADEPYDPASRRATR